MAVAIRDARSTEAAALAELAADTFSLACPPHLDAVDIDAFVATHLSPERFADYLNDTSCHILVAEDDGTLVGYCMLIAGEPADPQIADLVTARPCVELSKFYLRPRHHGQGFARELMESALELAAGLDAKAVWLGVNAFNMRAQRFYARVGFAMIGDRDFEVGGQTEHDYVLEYSYL